MKKISKVIMRIAAICAAVYLLLSITVSLFGKAIVAGQIEKNLKRKTTLDGLHVGFPFSLNIAGLNIRDLAQIDRLYIRPSIAGFLAGKIVLNELKLIRPLITLKMDEQGRLDIPQFAPKAKQPAIFLLGLDIKEGKIIFIDKKIDPSGYQLAVNNIDAAISKSSFPPTSLFIRFSISASLGEDSNKPRGKAAASGWVDFRPKDMDGEVELKDIDATYFAPYYREYISEKNLASGKLNFTSDLKAKNNDLKAKCRLEVSDLVYAKETSPEGQPDSANVVPAIMGLFSGSTRRASFDFTINTKLDKPRLSAKELKGIFGQAVVKNIANQSPENILGNIKDAEKQFKELGKSLKELFKKKE